MKTIWKFPIKITDQIIQMPHGGEMVHVGLDPNGIPCVWARVNALHSLVERSLYVIGTGEEEPDGDNRYIGSFVQESYVWHVLPLLIVI